jgi:gamma-butyrobetaine dioxygenase
MRTTPPFTLRPVAALATRGADAFARGVDAFAREDLVGQFPAVWLRDNCSCPLCRDAASGQKLHGVETLPADPTVLAVTQKDNEVGVRFSDGHAGVFARDWLLANRPDGYDLDPRTQDGKRLWRGAELDLDAATGSWPAFLDDADHRLRCLESVLRLGFVLLRDVPVRPGEVLAVAEGFGFVRETNYGRLFDVVARPDAPNLAFTSLPITPHTDNPYRDPVPTLQLLHCLTNEAEGGDSGLVDGFHAAATLRAEDPRAFAVLTRTPMTFRYTAPGTDLVATAPLIALDPRGRIRGVRYNNRSAQPLRLPYPEIVDFYHAYRSFAVLLADPRAGLSLRLGPGDCLVFDNTRVLHSRTGFCSAGSRHLQGCYADIDGLESQWRAGRG